MSKKIYCPKCGIKVFVWDGKCKSIIDARCRHCGYLVTYNPVSKITKIDKVPSRNTSSGMRFY